MEEKKAELERRKKALAEKQAAAKGEPTELYIPPKKEDDEHQTLGVADGAAKKRPAIRRQKTVVPKAGGNR